MIHPSAIIEDGARLAGCRGRRLQHHRQPGRDRPRLPNRPARGRDRHAPGSVRAIASFQFASIGEEPQDKKYAGEDSELIIGDNNTIREYVTINRGTADGGGSTRLGDDNWLMAYCHIAHDCQVGSHNIMANGATLAGHVTVGDHVIFAGYSGAHQFCRIGSHAFLGMYGGVSQDVPAYVMVSGQPPRPRGVNSEGLKRRGFSGDQIRNIREAYRTIYRAA
jgi:UDP-N-acetylglucosamine acyltransferase